MNKPRVIKGMQSFLLLDVHPYRLKAYLHRHKLHDKFEEVGWTQAGTCEIRMIIDIIMPLVVEEGLYGQ